MWLVKRLVDPWPMQPSVSQVNTAIREEKERSQLYKYFAQSVVLPVDFHIKSGMAVQFHQKPRYRQHRHDGNGTQRHLDLQRHLVLQVTRVVEDASVEHKHVTQTSCNQIQQPSENGNDRPKRQKLSQHVVTWQQRLERSLREIHQIWRVPVHILVDPRQVVETVQAFLQESRIAEPPVQPQQ